MPPKNNIGDSKSAMKLATNIKILRKQNGISVMQMSIDTGISQGYLTNIENLKKLPSLYTIDKISEYFKKEPYELFL